MLSVTFTDAVGKAVLDGVGENGTAVKTLIDFSSTKTVATHVFAERFSRESAMGGSTPR
jgi:hypothetical protein